MAHPNKLEGRYKTPRHPIQRYVSLLLAVQPFLISLPVSLSNPESETSLPVFHPCIFVSQPSLQVSQVSPFAAVTEESIVCIPGLAWAFPRHATRSESWRIAVGVSSPPAILSPTNLFISARLSPSLSPIDILSLSPWSSIPSFSFRFSVLFCFVRSLLRSFSH